MSITSQDILQVVLFVVGVYVVARLIRELT